MVVEGDVMSLGGHGSDMADKVGQAALARMRANRVAPTPENYAVWYAYCAGSNPELKRALDILLSNRTPFTPERNAEIYERFFGHAGYEAALGSTGENLETVMGRVQNLLDRAGRDSQDFDARMTSLSGGLSENENVADLQATVRRMLQETRAIMAKNQTLEQKLRESSEEVAALRDSLETAQRDALTDPLTGLANRKQFDRRLREASAEAAENDTPLCLVLQDIDHFKSFNDRFGHDVGDEVLKLVSRHLQDQLKGRDTPARFGGEEFAIILPHTTLANAAIVADHIRTHLSARRLTNKATDQVYDRVTVSAGIAVYRPGEPLEAFLRRADTALYMAKSTGRNRVVQEDALPDEDDTRPNTLADRLRKA